MEHTKRGYGKLILASIITSTITCGLALPLWIIIFVVYFIYNELKKKSEPKVEPKPTVVLPDNSFANDWTFQISPITPL